MKISRNCSAIFVFLIILFFSVVSGEFSTSAAGWFSFADADESSSIEVKNLNMGPDGLEFEIEFPGMFFQEVQIRNRRFVEVDMPGAGRCGETGHPSLPAFRRFIHIPFCEGFSIETEILEKGTVTLAQVGYGLEISPVQPPLDKIPGAYESMRVEYDESAYRRDGYSPEISASVGYPGMARGHRTVLLEAFPVSYNAVERAVEYCSGMRIKITFQNADIMRTKKCLKRYRNVLFDRLVSSFLINPEFMYFLTDYPPLPPPSFLIIVHDEFESAVYPFAQVKQSLGYDVSIANTSETGDTASEIKEYISEAYDTWPNPPVYVLLVGDTDYIPAWWGSHSYSETDIDYSLLQDGDYLPDVALGRWPVNSLLQTAIIVEKTLAYELAEMEEDSFYGQGVFIASSDAGGMAEDTHNWVISNYLEPDGHMAHRVWESQGGNTSDVIENLNEGRGWCVYSGHGSPSGWLCVYFQKGHIKNDLTNYEKYPLVSSHACSTNTYEDAECFGETWLVEEETGGIAFWGASATTQWDEDDIIEKGQFRGLVEDKIYAYSMTTDYGKYDLVLEYGWSGSVYDYYEKYVVHGDPSIDPFTDVPEELTVVHDPTAPVGEYDYEVYVEGAGGAVEGALVNLMLDEVALATGYTDSSGSVALTIYPQAAGEMSVNVSAHNAAPYFGICMVTPQGCGFIDLDREIYACGMEAEIAAWDTDLNSDPGVVDTAEVFLWSDSEPDPETLTITETGNDTNEFRGTILLSGSQGGPGYLLVSHGDTVTLNYYDEDCEGEPADVYDYAVMDCAGPVITGISSSEITDDGALISWITDELSDSIVDYGPTLPPERSVSDSSMTTEHSMRLSALECCEEYYFRVTSTDSLGNTTIDDNGGDYYVFSTLGRFLVMNAEMNSDPVWAISGGDWEYGIPLGEGGFAGSPDPESGHTGDHVYGYNLEGDYDNSVPAYHLTTLPVDCSAAGATILSFYRWLGASYSDQALLSASNDGENWDEYYRSSSYISDDEWVECTYDISETANGHSEVYVRWTMGPTTQSVTSCGWNIDDVQISMLASCNAPVLGYVEHGIDDSFGNGDSEPNPGEIIESCITLHNHSATTATGLQAFVTEDGDAITVLNGDIVFPDIPPESEGISIPPGLIIQISPQAQDGDVVRFDMEWTSAETSGTVYFSERVVAPVIEFRDFTIDDSAGNNDLKIDPGEFIRLPVLLKNAGHGTAAVITGLLSSDSAYIEINDETASWESMESQEACWSSEHFGFTVDDAAPIGEIVTFRLDIETQYFSGIFYFKTHIGARPVLVIDDDAGPFAELFVSILTDAGFAVSLQTAAETQASEWPDYLFIVWSAGACINPLIEDEWRENLVNYVNEGGRLLIEGGEICRDFEYGDWDFLYTVCHVDDWNANSSGNLHLNEPGHPLANSPYVLPSEIQHNDLNAGDEDACEVADGADLIYRWTAEPGGGVIAYDDDDDAENGGQTVFYSFTLGRIPNADVRARLLKNTAGWLLGIPDAPFTPTPDPTTTPTGMPTCIPTPTTVPTSLPTISPTPSSVIFKLILNKNRFRAGDDFILDRRLSNPGESLAAYEFIILDIYGEYWFYDDWTRQIDWLDILVPARSDQTKNILSFIWPDAAGSSQGLKFWGALLDDQSNLISNIDSFEWSFE